jgi:phosphonatase-like hydrolase
MGDMARIELAVFDLAGTTAHDPGAVNGCFRAALAAADVRVTAEEVNAVMGLAKPEAIRRLVAGSAAAAGADAIHADFVARMVEYYRSDPAVGEMPGAAEVFAQLRRAGVQVAINSGFGRVILDALLARLGWQGKVLSVASDEVARGRPHPDMIRHLMAQARVPSAACVAKVGDTPVDLEEGTNAGCGLVIGVTWGTHTREQLARYPHTHLVDAMAALPALITGATSDTAVSSRAYLRSSGTA